MRMRALVPFIALSFAACSEKASSTPAIRMIDLVDPLIGTGGRGWWAGSAFPGATAPFGLVQAGPDGTESDGAAGWDHCAGYNAADDLMMAFSNEHLHGTGIPDLGVIGFMPIPGSMEAGRLGQGHWSRFDHATEEARPGYYAVTLADHGIRAELTAGDLAATHRYTPAASGVRRITVLIDISHTIPPGLVKKGQVEVLPDIGEVRGFAHNKGQFAAVGGGFPVFFAARFARVPDAWGTWKAGQIQPAVAVQDGPDTGAWAEFDVADGGAVVVKVGISYVSIANAVENLDAGGASIDFDAMRHATGDAWEAMLSAVRCEGGTQAQQAILATSLYHAFMMPNRFSDADGSYIGLDRKEHKAGGFTYYTNFSLWDTYRTLHPLLILLQPERQLDMVRSLGRMMEEAGCVPLWPLGPVETNVMIGDPADVVVAETYLKGIKGFDVEGLYSRLRANATAPVAGGLPCKGRHGVADYVQLGWVAADHDEQSVSRTLEYAVADSALANLAAALGKTDDAATFSARSKNFKNLWNAKAGLFLPRNADGSWVEGVDPYSSPMNVGGPYTEGNANQYSFFVPHEMEGLVALLGSNETLSSRLESFFEGAVVEREQIASEPHEKGWWLLNPPTRYWHGNEPNIHAAYLFVQAGRPDLARKWLRWIADTLYTTARDGLPGNDDCGTLGAWYVFSALGFYPIPGTDEYIAGSPMFPKCEVRLGGGKTLIIQADGAEDDATTYKTIELNGKQIAGSRIRHSDIAGGGKLLFR